jgi:acetyl esterase
MGDRLSYDRLIRELAVGSDAALFFVDYTLAPEMQFPGQNDQAYEALTYIIKNALRYNIDASRVAVVGDGSGGNMAAATALTARMRCGPTIALQVLFYPILDDVSDNVSYRRFSNLATMTAADAAYFFDSYFPDQVSRYQPTAFPLKATIEQLRGVADALIVAGEYDILQYENEAYARKLHDAGVSVTYTCYRGALHGFVTLDALARTKCARGALREATHTLYEALHLRPHPFR